MSRRFDVEKIDTSRSTASDQSIRKSGFQRSARSSKYFFLTADETSGGSSDG
jgi:hypothetical protein